jgi:hypothetical protein
MMDDIWRAVPESLMNVRRNAGKAIELRSYAVAPDQRNEALFFLKPELCSDPGVKIDELCIFIDQIFTSFDVEVVAALVINGSYLEAHDIMARHYGTINRVSKGGLGVLTQDAKSALKTRFANELSKGAKALGGHQFLAHYPYFTAESLSILWDTKNAESVRIASGAYVLPFQVLSDRVLILNGFHPYQLKFFTGPDRCIACFIVRSAVPWARLRREAVGDTDPRVAPVGSIRRALLDNREIWMIDEVNKGLNGVHLSAGPIEAYFEIERFFGPWTGPKGAFDLRATNVRALSRTLNMDTTKLLKCRDNPIVRLGEKDIGIYEATEDKESVTALQLLASVDL